MQYYENMKKIRKQKGWTQQKIADALEISQQHYQQYESGANELPIRRLKQFCIIMNVSADEILELNQYKPL